MAVTDLRKWFTTILVDKSTSDNAQTPKVATVTVYRQGAKVNGAATVTVAGVPVTVRDIGQIVAGDDITIGTDPTASMRVLSVDSFTQLTLNSTTGGDVQVADGSRLVPVSNKPTLYTDSAGGGTTPNPTVTDASGFIQLYLTERVFDYKVSGTGVTTTLFVDEESGQRLPSRSDYNILEFPGTAPAGTVQVDVAGAIAAVPAGATLFFPAGLYMPPTAAGWTLSRAITIQGENAPDPTGATGTTFRPFNDDKDSTVFTISRDNVSIKDVFISCTAQPSATGTGDGIRIGDASWTPNGTVLDNIYIKFMGRHGVNVAADGNFNAAFPESTSLTHFGSDKMVITNSHFWNNRGCGVRLYAATSTSLRSCWALSNRLEGFRFRIAQTTSFISCAVQDNGLDLPNVNFRGQVVFSLAHNGFVGGLNVEDFNINTNKNGLANENSLALFVAGASFGNVANTAGSVAIQISAQARACTVTGWSVQNVEKAIVIEPNNKNSGNFITAPMVLSADATCPATMDIPDEATGAATSGGNLWLPPVTDYTGAHLQNQFAGIRMPKVAGTASVSASLLKEGLLIIDSTAIGTAKLKYYDGTTWRTVTAV